MRRSSDIAISPDRAALPRPTLHAVAQTATIVVTDLVGSTRLRVEIGEEQADQLRSDHDTKLSSVAEGLGGMVIKGTGDGLIIAFAGAAEALHASVALQHALHQVGRRGGRPSARVARPGQGRGISPGDGGMAPADRRGSGQGQLGSVRGCLAHLGSDSVPQRSSDRR